jgi:hypothetical protein
MRLPTYDKPRIVDTSYENAEYLSIPRGREETLFSLLDDAHAKYKIDDKRNHGVKIKAAFNGEFRPPLARLSSAHI